MEEWKIEKGGGGKKNQKRKTRENGGTKQTSNEMKEGRKGWGWGGMGGGGEEEASVAWRMICLGSIWLHMTQQHHPVNNQR